MVKKPGLKRGGGDKIKRPSIMIIKKKLIDLDDAKRDNLIMKYTMRILFVNFEKKK